MTDEMLALARRNAERGRRPQRDLPQGRDRGRAAAGRVGRRRHLELRRQPVDRQGGGADRDRPRAEARRARRHLRRGRRGPPRPGRARRARQLRRLHRRARSRVRSTRPGSRRAGFADVARRVHARGRGRDARRDRQGRQAAEAATVPEVLFVCVHNAGRSQMAAGAREAPLGRRIQVRSAGSEPAATDQPGGGRGDGRGRRRHQRGVPEAAHGRGRPRRRRRDHDGLRRRLPDLSRASATRTGSSTTRPARTSRRCAGSGTRSTRACSALVGELLAA